MGVGFPEGAYPDGASPDGFDGVKLTQPPATFSQD